MTNSVIIDLLASRVICLWTDLCLIILRINYECYLEVPHQLHPKWADDLFMEKTPAVMIVNTLLIS